MVEDGIEPQIVARIMVEAAHEALNPVSEPYDPERKKSAQAELLKLALSYQQD